MTSSLLRNALLTGATSLVLLGFGAGCGDIFGSLFDEEEPSPPGETTPPLLPPPNFPTTDAKPCTGLCTRQKQCAGGQTTSVSGKVFDPAGKVPLYNVLVFVPNATLAPIVTGASCDRCGNVSGNPLVTAITDASGAFKLENVPVGADIPLVVQVGKWRRQIVLPNVAECTDTPLVDGTARLPRNKYEGDLPQMAIATGDADPFECLLTKMGIDTAEFSRDTADGRVHFYRENGVNMTPPAPAASTLYTSAAKMKNYDIVFLPCEGAERDKSDEADANLVEYTRVGGRVFTTHYGYAWLHLGAAPFPTTGNWSPGLPDRYSTVTPSTINQGFPKGAAFAQWLTNVGASTTLGTIDLQEARHDLRAGNDPPSTTWMTTTSMPAPETNATMHVTFNTPIGVPEDQQCGRVVFSDFHVSADAKVDGQPFPSSCKAGDLSGQEKALEFMLFDLSSCIQSDKEPPQAPPIVN